MQYVKYFVVTVMLAGSIAALSSPAPVSALTNAEKKECNKRIGEILTTPKEREKFEKSTCVKSGHCKLTPKREISDDGTRTTVYTIGCDEDESGDIGDSPSYATQENCGDIETSVIKCDDTGGNSVVSAVLQLVNFLAVGVGIAVVGGIVWGGMLYASSNGDSSKAKQGITTIVNAVLGLLLFIFMYALINFIVPGGLFT